jgi:uncharacterized integral membrane protein (TIGR00698 family)
VNTAEQHTALTDTTDITTETSKKQIVPGLALVAALAGAAFVLAQQSWFQSMSMGPLTLAIVLGIVAGNTVLRNQPAILADGIFLAKGSLLRLGIILYGFGITFQQISAVGANGVLLDAIMIASTFALAQLIGRRWMKMEKETAILIGAGASICGAAAVLATEPVVKGRSDQVSVAVATVVIFGTISMFLYPLMYPLLGMTEHQFGIYVGSTVHEVAQVVAAGQAISTEAANSAIIEKMVRVMMLAPFLLILANVRLPNRKTNAGAGADKKQRQKLVIPWFAVLFLVAAAVNSVIAMPAIATNAIRHVDLFLLSMAMTSLGLSTQMSAIRRAGLRPLILAGCLFAFLTVGGYVLNRLLIG